MIEHSLMKANLQILKELNLTTQNEIVDEIVETVFGTGLKA